MTDHLSATTRRELLRLGAGGLAGIAAGSGARAADGAQAALGSDALRAGFRDPGDESRPWVYWYFMDGHLTEVGMRADLDAMRNAGIGGAIFLEVGLGLPPGPVKFMSEEWRLLLAKACAYAQKIGIEIALASGPGWCGTGGPWVKPDDSMQVLVGSEVQVEGPGRFDAKLEQPPPRTPFFGFGALNAQVLQEWRTFYRDECVIAYPTPPAVQAIEDIAEKALYTRGAYTSHVLGPEAKRTWVRPYLPDAARAGDAAKPGAIAGAQIEDLTGLMDADGHLTWNVPPGKWTIMRFGRRITAATTRPAPEPGLGLESDKFNAAALETHLEHYFGALLPLLRSHPAPGRGLTTLHFDSWEMGSQNWTGAFRSEFKARRGYDPLPFLAVLNGHVVNTPRASERFLWDLRETAQELVHQNHMQVLRTYAHRHGLQLSMQMYDLNPTADLTLGAAADVPMGEFWSKGLGFSSDFSVIEATSVGHTNGCNVIGGEAFTAESTELWQQYPGSVKEQGDWALCAGINRFVFHRFQAQPEPNPVAPGMTMGPNGGYGVHWDRTQPWWPMVAAYHQYIARCQFLLRRGLFVADILYLAAEGAPHVFVPPGSALLPGRFADRRGHNFDGCSPETLISRAQVRAGRIVFPDGMGYAILVLPRVATMSFKLLRKIADLVDQGATILGTPPAMTPGLSAGAEGDRDITALAARLWQGSSADRPARFGQGQVWLDPVDPTHPADNPLQDARWIWPEGLGPATDEVVFALDLPIDSLENLDSMEILVGAADSFEISVNGESIGQSSVGVSPDGRLIESGHNYRLAECWDFTALARPGSNLVSVVVRPSAKREVSAGFIAAVVVRMRGGAETIWPTGLHWYVADINGQSPGEILDLGHFESDPWKLSLANLQSPAQYPAYATAVRILRSNGIIDDFDGGPDLRAIHRQEHGLDIYFVSNRNPHKCQRECAFRVVGKQPEWWDPIDGSCRGLRQYHGKDGQTFLTVDLAAHQSGFIIFRRPSAQSAGQGENFPPAKQIAKLSGIWTMTFGSKDAPIRQLRSSALFDWSESQDPEIRDFSGRCTYDLEFDVAATIDPGTDYILALGKVGCMANVMLNGANLGVQWCAPWEIRIPEGLLKTSRNLLSITVTNQLINRLVGDRNLPLQRRKTQTPDNFSIPSKFSLRPSGLLGPIILLQRSWNSQAIES